LGWTYRSVAEEDHDLVVTEHDVHSSARRGGLPLQPVDEPQQAEDIGAAIGEVAGEDEVVAAAGPAQGVIDEAGRLEAFDDGVVLAVGVAEDEERVHGGDGRGRTGRAGGATTGGFVAIVGIVERAVAEDDLVGAAVSEGGAMGERPRGSGCGRGDGRRGRPRGRRARPVG
jgi:hypothetical protein